MNYQELPRLKDSISYIYLERTIIEQEDSAIIAIDAEGKTSIPISAVTCLLLGPGTSITHAAIKTICANGCMAIWCGGGAGRFYASGIGETASAKNLLRQAYCCMDEKRHLEVARKMYMLRFPKMLTDSYSIQQLRGMEGIRMRKVYELASKETGVKWSKRTYDKKDWNNSDPINRALSEANSLLYGICHAAIVSLGYSPALGFIHTGKQLSFVYDVGDLYKSETTIPAAFEAASKAENSRDLERTTRMLCREYFSKFRLLEKIPQDIAYVLEYEDLEEKTENNETGFLWTENGITEGGINYSEREMI